MARSRRTRRRGRGARLAATLLGLGLPLLEPASGHAEEPKAPAEPAPSVGLDKLLKLPDSVEYDVERRGGATRSEWRTRFREAHGDLEKSRSRKAEAQKKLEDSASDSSWRFAPPGASGTTEATENYKLVQEVKREDAEIQRLEKRLRDLEVEANLAGVPKDWRE